MESINNIVNRIVCDIMTIYCFKCSDYIKRSNAIMIDKIYQEEFAEKVINSPNTVVVDFFADWCGPCKMLSPVIEKLDAMNPDVDFYKVNIDENPSLAEEFEVQSIPNIVIFKNGQAVDRSIGFVSEQQLQEIISRNR